MMIIDTHSFLEHYARSQQQRHWARAAADRPGSGTLRLLIGRALVSLGAAVSGEPIERLARRRPSAGSV